MLNDKDDANLFVSSLILACFLLYKKIVVALKLPTFAIVEKMFKIKV